MKLSEKIKRSISGKEREDEPMDLAIPTLGEQEVHLSETEKFTLRELLLDNQDGSRDISEDYAILEQVTGEIKSINHQSVLLHGERIQVAKELFKSYGDVAFSRWLKEVYGNRQTPYNFLKYYTFYTSLNKRLQEKVVAMPKQIIYTIASRNCSPEDKERVVETYDGESKETYLKAIRKAFPLEKKDRRQKKKQVTAGQLNYLLDELIDTIDHYKSAFSLEELRLLDTKLKAASKSLWD